MADILSNSLANFLLFPGYTPPKPFHPLSTLSRTTTAGRWRRRRKPPQIIFFCKPNSQEFEVISTHEHADGSLIFRFGDPSELAKEDKLVESKLEKLERKDVEEFSVVKVFDGDCEREVIVKKVKRSVRNEGLTDADVTKISDSVVSRSESSSILERGVESGEQLLENSNDCFSSSAYQTGSLDHSASDVSTKKDGRKVSIQLTNNVEVQTEQGDRELSEKSASEVSTTNLIPLEEILVQNDGGKVSIQLTDNVEVQAEQGDRELNEKYASEVSTENVVPLEEIFVEKDWAEASIPLTDNVEVQADQVDRGSSEKSASKVSTKNVAPLEEILIKNDGVKASVPLTDNVEDQVEQVDGESSEKFATELSTKNAVPLEEIVVEKDDGEALIPLTDNGNTSVEVQADQGNRESSEKSASQFSAKNVATHEELNNNSPNLLLEVEQTEDVESSEPTEASGHEMVEVESTGASITRSKGIQTTELVLSSGAALLPHPSKALTGGGDAYFVTNQNWLGIADGVGQWSLEGIYPGVYSRELMENCEKVILQCGSDSGTDPKIVLKLSVAEVESPGTSTALIAHFDGQAFHVANIGDSGFMIIRNGVIYKKSSPMLHEFNFPMQIESGGDPSQIVEGYRIELDEGDTVVTGTDGLFDNLYAQEIASIIMKSLEANKTPKEIAVILATRAQEVGGAASGRSPFSDAAQSAGYVGCTGGKLDDVAVIVSLVQKHTS